MAQSEQKDLYFDVEAEEINGYIDTPACVTSANRKQYHQVTASGDPLYYRIMVEQIKGDPISFYHMSNGFIVGNAVKMTAKGWKAQMRNAGIKLRNLPPYGRRPRFALEEDAWNKNTTAISGETIYQISDTHLQPRVSPGGNLCFSTYTATDDMQVFFREPTAAVNKVAANQLTQVVVTDGAGTETSEVLTLSKGTSIAAESFNVINQYLKARRQTPDVSIDTPGVAEDSDMLNLFSVAEETSDDIIDAVDEYMDYKPYTPDDHTNTFDDLVLGGTIGVNTTGANYPPNTTVMDVPLGLLKISAPAGSSFRLRVLAIYEM